MDMKGRAELKIERGSGPWVNNQALMRSHFPDVTSTVSVLPILQ
jgi:hypothetical protein